MKAFILIFYSWRNDKTRTGFTNTKILLLNKPREMPTDTELITND